MMRVADLFSGWGGFTTGAVLAGARPVYAANHWPLAVSVHASNHPSVQHECQDLRQADFSTLPAFDLLLASPACQGHAKPAQPARAGSEDVRRKHDALRATAWAVVDCADVTEPRAIVVENVVEFVKWRLYPEWRGALERIGYAIAEHRVIAADHDVPQLRERIFIVGMKGKRVALPIPFRIRPSFGPCIDWEGGEWRPIANAALGGRSRIDAAQKRLGPRCLVHHVTGHRGVPLDEPIRTITTKDQWIVVDGDRYRPLTLREYARAMGFAESYAWPDELSRVDVIKGLGNAVCPPVARDVVAAVMEAA